MSEIVVFHAGKEELNSFRPCVHVGTRQAAIDRLSGANGYLHECRLKESDSTIEIEDWGANTGPALFVNLCEYFGKNGKTLEQGFFDGARALLNHAKNKNAGLCRELQESFLTAQLISRGISIIKYKNDVEDAGSYSYFVLDPEFLSITKVEKI